MRRKIGIVPVLLFIILFMTLGGCVFRRPAPDQAAQGFLDLLTTGRYKEMYQQLSSDAQSLIDETSFISYYQNIYQQIGNNGLKLEIVKPAEGQKWEIKNNRVKIPVKGTMATWTVGELSMDQTLEMMYEDKRWRVEWKSTNILPQLTDLSYHLVVTRTIAERGNIYDRNGEKLVGPGTICTIGLVPAKIKDLNETLSALTNLLDVPEKRIEQALQQKWVRPELFVPVRSIVKAEWLLKKDKLLIIPGVMASFSEGRVFSGPQSFAPTLGYLGEINKAELNEWAGQGYQVGDRVGRDGLERKFEKYLAGRPGFMIRIVDEAGKEKAIVKFTHSVQGGDLNVTIDLRLQRSIEKAMGNRRGAVIAMAPKTGEILACASFPGFDPNEFVFGVSATRIAKILNDLDKPLLNRVIQGKYIPGSTFKPLTALAALEFNPKYDPTEEIAIPNSTWRAEVGWGNYVVKRVPRPAGPVNLFSAMKWSDNIYFAKLAYNMGSEAMFKMADRAGFAQQIPFTLDVALSTLAEERPIINSILLADTGYGQGQILLTPLHLAMLYSAIATDGKIRQPALLTDEERDRVWKDEPLASAEHLKLLQEVLRVTVQDKKAFANEANIPVLIMAGKTGTAQIGNKKEMGWFVSYHPVDDPEMLLLVGIEDSINGSHDAMAVSKKILLDFYQIYQK